MLKLQPARSIIPEATVKCGEIFCQSFRDFTIFCTFCQMKSFQIDDFVLHIQNVHSKSGLSIGNNYLNELKEVNLKNETQSPGKYIKGTTKPEEIFGMNVKYESKHDIWDETERTSLSSNNTENEYTDEENLRILKNSRRKKNKLKRSPNISCDQFEEMEETKEESQNNGKRANDSGNTNKRVKSNEYSCPECRTIFSQKKCLDQHVRDLHNGYKCPQCDKRFSRTSHVECHLKTHATEKRFKCPIKNCCRGFIDQDYLKRHLEVHTMERNFICEFENCGKAFQTQRRLASHEYTHKIPKKFICDMCGYSCRSNPQLITHQRVHTGEKPFPCEICEKPFISKVALQEHMISHSKTRPHVCPVCNRAFANRRVLVRHSFIHTEEKTFKCKLCESSFKHPNSLQGHMRHVHKEPKHKSQN